MPYSIFFVQKSFFLKLLNSLIIRELQKTFIKANYFFVYCNSLGTLFWQTIFYFAKNSKKINKFCGDPYFWEVWKNFIWQKMPIWKNVFFAILISKVLIINDLGYEKYCKTNRLIHIFSSWTLTFEFQYTLFHVILQISKP